MSVTRIIHAKFGGCAAYRARVVDGTLMHGAWAASDPALWETTASLTLGELATKLEAMAPRTIAFRPDEPWTVAAQTSADVDRAERLRVPRTKGGKANVGRARAVAVECTRPDHVRRRERTQGRRAEQLALALGA